MAFFSGNSLTKPDLVNQAEGRNQLAAESSQWDNNGHTRVDRSVKDDMEKGLKEFSDRMAKLPDQMGGAVKKFFEERGISWDGIQKILGEIWKNVEQLIEMVKKAM